MSGYHIRSIEKGVFGEWSKVVEEFQEIQDAQEQNNKIMELVEISDMYGAIEEYLKESFNMSMEDIKTMSDITKKVFREGHRKSKEDLYTYLLNNSTKILEWGLGFIQVKVGRINYNFYTDSVVKFSTENPHSHKYDFESMIIKGNLKETVYKVSKEGVGDLEVVSNRCSTGTFNTNTHIVETYYKLYKTGDTYKRPAPEFHTVACENGTITRVTKTSEDYNNPVSIKLIEECAYRGVLTEEEMWNIVKVLSRGVYEY